MPASRLEEYKIAVVGGGGVGKSAICVQFVQSVFVEEYDPTVSEHYRKNTMVDDRPVFLDIFDTAGQEEYADLRKQRYQTDDGFILVCSVLEPKSLRDITLAWKDICSARNRNDLPVAVVGNKTELEDERKVSSEEIEKMANEEINGAPVFETSAAQAKNIEELFHAMVKRIREFKEKEAEKGQNTTGNNSKGCCSLL